MNFLTKEGIPLSIEEARNQILGIWSLIGRFGATSYAEKNQIDDILKRLKSEEISPDDAVKEDNDILINKNGFESHYR